MATSSDIGEQLMKLGSGGEMAATPLRGKTHIGEIVTY